MCLGVFFISAVGMADIPQPWQLGFQEAVTPVMESIKDLHDFLLIIVYVIGIFVFILLFYAIFRFRASKNPTPSTRTHNALLEVIWTVIPVIILLVVSVPSFKLLFFMDKTDNPEMTIKVTGSMWLWNYSYIDHEINFDSNIVLDEDLKPNQLRLLEVDNQIVVPVNTNVRLIFTAADVIHSWTIPAFGVKKDCIPGRLNEAWFRITKEGVYYGQCSELCGMKHGFMPIAVRAVSKEKFKQWAKEAKEKFAMVQSIFPIDKKLA